MSAIRICTHVAGHNLTEFISNLEAIQQRSSFVELRVDYIENFTIDDIAVIQKKVSKPAIFTCRKGEGGKYKGTAEQHKAIIQEAINQGFDYVDIEYPAIEKYDLQRNPKTKIILCYHNFDETPKYWKLLNILNAMQKHSPDIIKIATTIQSEEDNKTLFRLLADKSDEDNWIIIGMGEKGRVTRIINPILGSYLTFATPENATVQFAPGQISSTELQQIYKTLGVSTE